MNEVLRIAMQADAGQVVRAFSIADSAGKKFGATLEALNFGGRVVMGTLDSMAKKVRNFGLKVAAGGTALGVGFLGAVRESVGLETALNNVNSLVGRSQARVQQWGRTIIDLSRDGVQGVQTLAKGMYNVASAGYFGKQGFDVLNASQRAATAGMTDVDTASKSIIMSLRAYGLEANQSRKVSDYLFQSVNSGIYTFEELAQNIGDILPMAAAAKVDLKEVAGAMAAVTRAGLNPAEGATSIQRLIQQIVDPSKELAKVYQRIGYESGAAALEQDGLYKVIKRLGRAGGDNLTTLLQWFPEIRAARGALALMSADGRNYTDVMHQMDNATKGQGATQRALNEQMKSVSLQWEQIKNKVTAFLTSLGQTAMPFLHFFVGLINSGADLLEMFDSIPGPVKTFIGLLVGGTAVVMARGGAVIALRAKSILMALGFKGIAAGIKSIVPAAAAGEGAIGKLTNKIDRMGRLRNAALGHGGGLMGRLLFGSGGPNALQRAGDALRARALKGSGMDSGLAQRLAAQAGQSRNADAAARGYNAQMTIMGRLQDRLGRALQRSGGAAGAFRGKINSVITDTIGWSALMGSTISAVLAFGMAWKSAGDEAEQAVGKIDAKIKKGRLGSVVNASTELHDKFLNTYAKWDKKANSEKFVMGEVKGIGDLLTNTFGWDPIKDSPFDIARMKEKIATERKKINRMVSNYRQNYTEIALQTGQASRGEGLNGAKNFDILSEKARTFDHVAKILGVDLSHSFSSSKDAREQMIAHFDKARAGANAFGKDLASVTDADIKRIQDLNKTLDKMAQGVSQNFFGQLGLGDSYDPEKRDTWDRIDPNKKGGVTIRKLKGDLIPAQKQIADYYQSVIDNTTTFVDDLNTVIEQGLDPAAVMEITQEGPQKAGKALHQVVQDTSGSLVQIMNESYSTMGNLADRAIAYNRIVTLATQDQSGKLFQDYRKALTVQNEVFKQGGKATWKSVASALSQQGFTEGDIQKINQEFGLGIQKALSFKMPDNWAKNMFGGAKGFFKDELQRQFQSEYRSLMQFTNLTTDQGQIYMRLRVKGDTQGIQKFIDGLPDELKEQVVKITATWNESNHIDVAREIDKLNLEAKSKKVIFNTIFANNGKPMTTQSVRDLQLHYGLTDRDLKYYVTLAAKSGVPGALEVLRDLNDAVGEVHYYKVKLTVDSKTGKDKINDYINDLIGISPDKQVKLVQLQYKIDKGNYEGAKTELSNLLGSGAITKKEFDVLMKMVGDEEVSQKLRVFLASLPPDRKIDVETVMKLLGQEGALNDLRVFQEQTNMTAEEVITTVSLLGTDEAIDSVGKYISGLNLTPPQVETLLKSIDVDPQTRWRIQQWMVQHNGDEAMFYLNMQSKGEAEANAAMERVRAKASLGAWMQIHIGTDGPTSGRDLLPHGGTKIVPAVGGIVKFAQGGMSDSPHVAQIAKAGTWRVWAEDETGGEAYIPLGLPKRKRSTDILREVADRFGMMIVPRGTASYASGGLSPVSSSTVHYAGSSITIEGSQVIVQGNADRSIIGEVEKMMDRRDRKLADKLTKNRG